MSADGFITDDVFFCCALMYIFTEAALTRIEFVESNDPSPRRHHNEKKFYLDIPSLDAEEYRKEFKAGTLAISDLMSYVRTYNWVSRTIQEMGRRKEMEWSSPSWITGRG